jgi:trimethylamine--corrinoid protein Co-methyltransferase
MSGELTTDVRPQYRLLTEAQIQALHAATLQVLETVGVRVSNDEAVALLQAAGCPVKEGQVVLFPQAVVEQALATAPKSITLYNRAGNEAMRLTGRNSYYGLGTDLIHTYDLQTGELRPTVLQDVVNAATVADALSGIDFIASFGLPHDVPTNTMYIECVRAMLRHSTKPIFTTAGGAEDLAVIIEMAEVVAGDAAALREKPRLIH